MGLIFVISHTSISSKVQIYNEFIPVFTQLLNEIMKVLEISRLDQILPSIKALKILVSSSFDTRSKK